MSEAIVKLPSDVSTEQFEAFKAKYGKDPVGGENVFVIELKDKADPSKVFRCVVRHPDEKILGLAMPFLEKNMFKLCKILIVNCWLGGDGIIKEFSPYIMKAGGKLVEYLDQAEAEIENF